MLANLFLTIVLFQGSQTPMPPSPAPDAVVARVNGQDIHAKDVEAYLWDWRGSEVTGDLITHHLILAEAQRVGAQVSQAEIEQVYNGQMETMKTNVPPGQDLDSVLRQQGMPKSRLYLRIYTDLLLNQIALKEFKPADYVKVSTVAFIPKSDAAADLTTAIGRAQSAYDRLSKGGDWMKEVNASDDDAALKQHNGVMGWRALSLFPGNTQAELKTGNAGALAKPTQAAKAIQVFRVEARGQDAKGKDLDELRQVFLSTSRQSVIERLRKDAKIERLYPATEPPKK